MEKGRSAGSTNASASCTGQAQPPSEHAHAASHRAGRFGPLADLHGPGTAAQGPQNTHTRHRTEQAAKDTQRVPTRVPSTGTHGLPAALHSACCSFQSWLFMPFAPVGLLLSLSPPAGSAALGTCHLIIMQGHAASLPCNSGLPIADTPTAYPPSTSPRAKPFCCPPWTVISTRRCRSPCACCRFAPTRPILAHA